MPSRKSLFRQTKRHQVLLNWSPNYKVWKLKIHIMQFISMIYTKLQEKRQVYNVPRVKRIVFRLGQCFFRQSRNWSLNQSPYQWVWKFKNSLSKITLPIYIKLQKIYTSLFKTKNKCLIPQNPQIKISLIHDIFFKRGPLFPSTIM